jgi:hypothetical protein
VGLNLVADKLLENKGFFKLYLIVNGWTNTYMTNHHWKTDRFGYLCYGPQTDNWLSNTKGVFICPKYGIVGISHFDEVGMATTPYIRCTEDYFGVIE